MADKTATTATTTPRPQSRRRWTTPTLRAMPASHTQAGPTPIIQEGPFAYGS